MIMTNHGAVRMQQRAISEEMVDILLRFGRSIRRHHAEVYFMTKRDLDWARRALGRSRYLALERKRNAYVVASDDGAVITVGYRRRRLW